MKSITELIQLNNEESSKIKSERASIVKDFVERLNSDRKKEGYKSLRASFYAVKMAHMNLEDLYWFYKNCETASCGFSRAWWGSLKNNGKNTQTISRG